ncbi:MAG TPA: ABC transporter substrate-binding protein [Stellaceae bacterium]|nr:ABC transporter substrate-binding protein [Stellaceae bacterium]
MSRWAKIAALAAATLAVAPLAARAQEAGDTDAMKALAAAADKEGTILLTWSSDTLGGADGAQKFEAAINKAYGTHIHISWTPGPAMPVVGSQIAMAHANNLPSPTDVYMGFSRDIASELKYDLFQTAPWKSYVPDRLTDQVVEHDTYVKVESATLGFTYNKKLAPSEPKELADLLKPEWTGKIATTSFGAGWDQIAATDAWGPDKAIAFAQKFAKQVAGFMRCGETERLSTGEFLAMATDCSDGPASESIAHGAPLGRAIEPTVPLISYFYLAVPKNAVHPNGGKLFVAFSATVEGQKIIRDETQTDLHLFPESVERQRIEQVQKEFGTQFKNADIDWQIGNTAGNAAQKKIADIIQGK